MNVNEMSTDVNRLSGSSELKIEENIIMEVVGKAIPKTENDQNTDDIIPARFMKEITFANMGKYAYYDQRYKDGEEIPSHPLNKYKGGTILIGGANYGCGSSREHAPQALHRYGITAVIAESFAEIFAGNCASLGIVSVTIPKEEIESLAEFIKSNPESEVTIDIENKKVKYADKEIPLEMLEGRRNSFLNGTWDALAILKQDQEGINKIENELEYLKF